jgi:hypothetical protein
MVDLSRRSRRRDLEIDPSVVRFAADDAAVVASEEALLATL